MFKDTADRQDKNKRHDEEIQVTREQKLRDEQDTSTIPL